MEQYPYLLPRPIQLRDIYILQTHCSEAPIIVNENTGGHKKTEPKAETTVKDRRSVPAADVYGGIWSGRLRLFDKYWKNGFEGPLCPQIAKSTLAIGESSSQRVLPTLVVLMALLVLLVLPALMALLAQMVLRVLGSLLKESHFVLETN